MPKAEELREQALANPYVNAPGHALGTKHFRSVGPWLLGLSINA